HTRFSRDWSSDVCSSDLELLRLLSGLDRLKAGQLFLEGRPLNLKSPRDAIAAGVLLCPEDRKKEGIVPLASVAENINISARSRHAALGCLITAQWERENADRQISALKVNIPSP